jgi:hypothetical protein
MQVWVSKDALFRLEPYDGKLSRTVLKGERGCEKPLTYLTSGLRQILPLLDWVSLVIIQSVVFKNEVGLNQKVSGKTSQKNAVRHNA